MRKRPKTEIIPTDPEGDRYAMYLDDDLIGFARSAADGRTTLARLEREIGRIAQLPGRMRPRHMPRRQTTRFHHFRRREVYP